MGAIEFGAELTVPRPARCHKACRGSSPEWGRLPRKLREVDVHVHIPQQVGEGVHSAAVEAR